MEDILILLIKGLIRGIKEIRKNKELKQKTSRGETKCSNQN